MEFRKKNFEFCAIRNNRPSRISIRFTNKTERIDYNFISDEIWRKLQR